MDSFGKQVMASIIGSFIGFMTASVAFTVLSVVAIGVMVAVAGSTESEPAEIEKNSVFILDLEGEIVEHARPEDYWIDELFSPNSERKISLMDIKKAIRLAAKEENIETMYLRLRSFNGGFASAQAIRRELIKFKESGKPIVVYTDSFSLMAYYLVSVGDQLYLHPEAQLTIKGLASVPLFFKGTLDELGIRPEVFKAGRYKSAVEPFINEQMSEDYRAQVVELLEDIWGQITKDLIEARPAIAGVLDQIAREKIVVDAKEAVELGFYDGLKTSFDVQYLLWDTDDDKKRHRAGMRRILAKEMEKSFFDFGEKKNKVAIIIAEGSIGMGSSSEDSIGADTVVSQTRRAFEDKDVKAVVLRVNSPGGGAFASDIMWGQFRQSQLKHKKPFVASFSDVAASGGYYMAAGADKVFAEPLTLTGSIGVFGLMFNVQELMEAKFKLRSDSVLTHPYADFGSGIRPMSEFERSKIQSNVEDTYRRFLTVVKTKRPYETFEEVDQVAQGKVYVGSRAKELKLVDELGGLDEAVAEAAKLANLTNYEPYVVRDQLTPAEKIKESLGLSWTFFQLKHWLGLVPAPAKQVATETVKTLDFLVKQQGVMAFWPSLRFE